MKQKLTFSIKIMATTLLFLSLVTVSCKKDNSAQEEEITTNDPRLLGKWSHTTSTGPNSTLISTYEFKAGQVLYQALVAQSNFSGMTVISDATCKWTTANNNTVTIQATGATSTEKYIVDGKKLLLTASDNKQTEYTKFD